MVEEKGIEEDWDESKAEETRKAEERPEEKREAIKIKDYSVFKPCSTCGDVKVPYIEIEADGKAEFTCKECYNAKYSPKAVFKCPSCSSDCEEEDNFCFKCGCRLRVICPTCGSKGDKDDKFCRQCGTKLKADWSN